MKAGQLHDIILQGRKQSIESKNVKESKMMIKSLARFEKQFLSFPKLHDAEWYVNRSMDAHNEHMNICWLI